MQWYRESVPSDKSSLKSMPSVMNLMRVSLELHSSNLTLYPTVEPSVQPISSATRLASAMAATLLGCVMAILNDPFVLPKPSKMYCGIWVVFPLPVSPTINKQEFFAYADIILSFAAWMGSLCSTVTIL